MKRGWTGAVLGGLLLITSLVSGCAAQTECDIAGGEAVNSEAKAARYDNPGEDAKPTSVAELYERYKANEVSDNFHMVMACNLGMTILGERTETLMTEEGDVVGDAAHAIASADIGGQTTEVEVYVAEESGSNMAYVKSSETGTWTKQEYGSASGDVSGYLDDAENFEDAQFAETKNGYVVTRKGASLDGLSLQLGSLDALGEDVREAYETAFKNATTTIEFGENCLPRSLDMQVSIPLDGTSVAAILSDLSIDLHIDLRDYGSVDPKSVTVPESVVNAATTQVSW